MQITFRTACAEDVETAAGLIYSAGPEAFEFCFTSGDQTATSFLKSRFPKGDGFFGWRTHTVATIDGIVVGILATYSGREYHRLTLQTTMAILKFYRFISLPGVIRRSLKLSSLMPPPAKNVHYISNFAVDPSRQGQGIGSALLNQQKLVAEQLGRNTLALDVSVDNPRGQALYERHGFKVTAEQQFRGPQGTIANTRRMQLCLK